MPPKPEHDRDEYEGWTDTQLVSQVTGNAGAAGAGASAELMRRLMLQLQTASERADAQDARLAQLTTGLVVLTVALLVVTVVLAIRG